MADSRTQAEMEKAAHDFVQRLQVRADPWEVSEKTLVELFTKFALAQRKEAVPKQGYCLKCGWRGDLCICHLTIEGELLSFRSAP